MAGKAAVERAFSAAIVESRKRPNVAERAASDRTRSRTPEEMAILGEQFYQAVCANPGETMITLGGQVSATAQSLRNVVKRLKRERRIRSAGQRQETRYSPMAEGLGVGEPPIIG
jgi:hypothetical protein